MVFLHGQGVLDSDRAEAWVEHGRAMLDRLDAHRSAEGGRYHNAVGALRASRGRSSEAATHYRTAIEVLDRLEDQVATTAAAHANLGLALASLGRNEDAAAELRTALHLREAAYPAEHFVVGESLANLGSVLRLFDPEEAIVQLERARTILTKYDGPATNLRLAIIEVGLAQSLRTLGRPVEAVEHAERAIARTSPGSGGEPSEVDALITLGESLLDAGQLARSADSFHRALAANHEAADVRGVSTLMGLARVEDARGRPDRAAGYRSRANTALAALGNP